MNVFRAKNKQRDKLEILDGIRDVEDALERNREKESIARDRKIQRQKIAKELEIQRDIERRENEITNIENEDQERELDLDRQIESNRRKLRSL